MAVAWTPSAMRNVFLAQRVAFLTSISNKPCAVLPTPWAAHVEVRQAASVPCAASRTIPEYSVSKAKPGWKDFRALRKPPAWRAVVPFKDSRAVPLVPRWKVNAPCKDFQGDP